MAADTVTGSRPHAVKRGTTPATIGNVRRVNIPDWTRGYTVEAPKGGFDLKVAWVGTDDTPIGSAQYVDVYAGAGPREFPASEGRERAQVTAIYIASVGVSADYVVEAEAIQR